MEWSLPIVSLTLLAVAAVSRKLRDAGQPAMVFVAVGLLIGPEVLGRHQPRELELGGAHPGRGDLGTGSVLRCVADRSPPPSPRGGSADSPARHRPPADDRPRRGRGGCHLRSADGRRGPHPGCGPGPHRRGPGAGGGHDPRVPGRIRQGLNVESGLNDGICVPLLFAAVAAADVESEISDGRSARRWWSRRSASAMVGGVVAGLLIAAIVIHAGGRDLIAGPWRQVIPAAGAALAYGMASALGGSGFIGAFVGGMAFRLALRRDPEDKNGLSEEVGSVLNGVTFVLFGAILLEPGAGRADLGARSLRGPQPYARAHGPGRGGDARYTGPACRRSVSSAGSAPAAWPRSCSRSSWSSSRAFPRSTSRARGLPDGRSLGLRPWCDCGPARGALRPLGTSTILGPRRRRWKHPYRR